MVTLTRGGGFSRDSNCPIWKSLSFCSMPRGRGCKGGAAPCRWKQLQPPTTTVSMVIGAVGGLANVAGSTTGGLVNTAGFAPSDFPFSSVFPMHPPSYHPGSFHQGYSHFAHDFPYPYPYPYQPPPSPSRMSNPYKLCFIKGNISTCIGYRNHYPKQPQPPHDLCIKRQEWRQFTPHGAEAPQSKFSNVYYHCKPECVCMVSLS